MKGHWGNKEPTLKSPSGKLKLRLRQATGRNANDREREMSPRVLGGEYIVWGTLNDRHMKVCRAWPGQGCRDITQTGQGYFSQ